MGCSVRSGNMGSGLKGETGDTPQVDSSPLSKNSLMSKVNQIGLLEGSGHPEVRAFGHLDKPGAPESAGPWGCGELGCQSFHPSTCLGFPQCAQAQLAQKHRVCQAPPSGWGTPALSAQESPCD